jgi:methyl-accepting chemotaxis protein
MNPIRNLKLKNKLILMLVVPLLALSGFSAMLYSHASRQAENAARMVALVNMAIAVSRAEDRLLEEYDLASRFLKARGKQFREALQQARTQTDETLTAVERQLQRLQGFSLPEEFGQRVAAVGESRAQLAGLRQQLDAVKLRRGRLSEFYPRFSDQLLGLVELLPKLSLDRDLTIASSAYASFLRLKTLAEEERHVLYRVFERDQFIGKEFAAFTRTVNEQAVYRKIFLDHADAAQRALFEQKMQDPAVTEAEAMRDKAFVAADYGAFNIDPAAWEQAQNGKIALLTEVADRLTGDILGRAGDAQSAARFNMWMVMLVSLLAISLTVLMWWLISGGIARAVAHITRVMDGIAAGRLDHRIEVDSKDEFGHLLESLSRMQDDLRQRGEEEGRIARANARVRQALDNVSASVMVADQNNDIIYINAAAKSLFTRIEPDLQQELPDFRASEIVGNSIDRFHKQPQHQHRLLERLNGEHRAEFRVGGRSMSFIANPVLGEQGERLGTVVEWKDRTHEVNTESEIQEIVRAVQQGSLERRIETAGKEGFFLRLSESINEMVATIGNTMDDINVVMSALSRGDLTQSIDNDYQGAFGEVADSVNETVEKLSQIVGEIRASAQEVSATAKEILDGNNSLSARTEHQASALEQTASSMEQITSTVKQNSDNAQLANQLAEDARQTANKGGEVVSRAVEAMDEINRSSEKIAEIIGVIDEIAFQTNLLALNASVEAARAGEQGRGFAVVATEVRNLAQRSATAAKEIKELIQDSVGKVNAGSELVNQSGDTLQEIVNGIRKVGDIVGEIAAASAEQTAGIEQVNAAVTSMDETTQQNAALAEQTSAASQSMVQRSEQMTERLAFFRLDAEWDSTVVSLDLASTGMTQQEAPAAPAAAPPEKAGVTPLAAVAATASAVAETSSEPVFDDDDWEEF